MLAGFGAEIVTETTAEGRVITLTGQPELSPQTIAVPRDPSSAAFPVCAALMTEGSDVLVPNIGLNPTRACLYTTLREMGADLTYENEREEGGEPVADLRARFSPHMIGIDVPPDRAASMIDEYPILSVVAACAEAGRLPFDLPEAEHEAIPPCATRRRLRGEDLAHDLSCDAPSKPGCGGEDVDPQDELHVGSPASAFSTFCAPMSPGTVRCPDPISNCTN